MLAKGFEPSTVRLQGGCSTIELHQQNKLLFVPEVFFLLKQTYVISNETSAVSESLLEMGATPLLKKSEEILPAPCDPDTAA